MATKRKIGDFQLEKKLGMGGMGIVYLATYVKTGQQVALKVLSPGLSAEPKLIKRFEREIAILKKLKHPHIVQYYGGGKHGDQRFYAMELMQGGSVEQLIEKKGRLPWEQVIDFGKQMCEGLEHAHNHAIIHRDLKPANLFLNKSGKLKLGDFGIARDNQATALTAAGKTVGTYAYMAPEQIDGKHPVSAKTDLYGLGCVLFEMLAGRPPFEAETQAEMLFQHVQNEPPRVTEFAIDCPIWLEAIVMQLLEKDPQARQYDALAVHTALDEVGQKVVAQSSISGQTALGGPTGVTVDQNQPELRKLLGKPRKKRKKKAVPFYERAWFLAACLVLLVGGVTWAMWPLSEDELFARAQPLMQSDDIGHWRTAREKFLDPLLERFPNGNHAQQAREYIEKIDVETALRRAEIVLTRNREPNSTGERLLVEAMRAQKSGDRIVALAKFRGMIKLLELQDQQQSRPYIKIAERRILEIQQSDNRDDLDLIKSTLRTAESYVKQGEQLKADELWSAVVDIYNTNREFETLVNYARDRRAGEDVEPINLDDPEPTQNANGSHPPDGDPDS